MLILNEEQMLDLAEMNASADPARCLEPIRLPDGRHALDADLLMICDPGEPWWHFRTLLMDLPAETIETVDTADATRTRSPWRGARSLTANGPDDTPRPGRLMEPELVNGN